LFLVFSQNVVVFPQIFLLPILDSSNSSGHILWGYFLASYRSVFALPSGRWGDGGYSHSIEMAMGNENGRRVRPLENPLPLVALRSALAKPKTCIHKVDSNGLRSMDPQLTGTFSFLVARPIFLKQFPSVRSGQLVRAKIARHL